MWQSVRHRSTFLKQTDCQHTLGIQAVAMKERPRPDHPGKERCFSRNECHVWLKNQWITVIFYDFLWYFAIDIQKRHWVDYVDRVFWRLWSRHQRFEMFQDVSSHDPRNNRPVGWAGRPWPLQTIFVGGLLRLVYTVCIHRCPYQ